jgi:hypothetical protein
MELIAAAFLDRRIGEKQKKHGRVPKKIIVKEVPTAHPPCQLSAQQGPAQRGVEEHINT